MRNNREIDYWISLCETVKELQENKRKRSVGGDRDFPEGLWLTENIAGKSAIFNCKVMNCWGWKNCSLNKALDMQT